MRRLGVAAALALVGLVASAVASAAEEPTPPIIKSFSVSDVTTTTATLKATVNFRNLNDANWHFAYCRQVECPAGTIETERVEEAPVAEETPLAIEEPIDGLSPSTTYSVTLVAENDEFNEAQAGAGQPPVRQTTTFRTADPVLPPIPVAPQPLTEAATGVTQDVATLHGKIVPGTTGGAGVTTSVFFEWGVGEAFDHATPTHTYAADAVQSPVSASISGLDPNRQYAFRLVAVRGGQRYPGAVQRFLTPTAKPCPEGAAYRRLESGRVIVSGCLFGDGAGHWVSTGEVSLNGLALEPQSGGSVGTVYGFSSCTSPACQSLQEKLRTGNRFYLDRDGGAFGTTGIWKMSAGERLRGICVCKLTANDVEWDGSGPLLTLGANASVDLFGGFPLAGEFTWTPDPDGGSRLGMYVGIPFAAEGITGQTTVRVNPGGDVVLDGLKVTVGKIAIRQFEIGNLSFLYDRPEDLWEGSAGVVLPIPSRRIKVGATVAVKEKRFSRLEGEVDDINQHLGYGVYLQKVGVAFGLQPLLLGGSFGLSAGPEVLGTSLLGLDGGFLFRDSYETTRNVNGIVIASRFPPSFTVNGRLTVADYPVRENSITWYIWPEPWFTVSGKMTVGPPEISGFRLWGLDATLGGSLRGTEFSAEAEGSLVVLSYDVAGAKGLLNNKGIAACGYANVAEARFAIGGWMAWSGSNGSFYACDMETLRTRLAGASAVASAATASGAVPIELHPGDSQALIRIVGAGGVPRVRLHGPGGRTIETPDTSTPAPGTYPGALVLQDPSTDSLYVFVAPVGDGHWSYEPLDGSAPVARIETARPLPRARVRAKVSAAPRGRRILSWRLRAIPGQRVSFLEETPGAPPRPLQRTRRAAGSVAFRPQIALSRKRAIVAIVEQDGRPRDRFAVARYTAPPLGRVRAVEGLRARRQGGRIAIAWRGQRAALEYHIVVTDERGGRRLEIAGGPGLVLSGAAAASARSVTVRAVGYDGRVSRPVTVRLAGAPRLSKLGLTKRSVSLRLSAPASVEIRLARCRGGRCRPAAKLTAPDSPAGTLRLALPRGLAPGRYRVVARARVDGKRSRPLRRTVALR